jgi:hypothetical protein
MIKRYDCFARDDQFDYEPDKNGEWVRWDDLQALVGQLIAPLIPDREKALEAKVEAQIARIDQALAEPMRRIRGIENEIAELQKALAAIQPGSSPASELDALKFRLQSIEALFSRLGEPTRL